MKKLILYIFLISTQLSFAQINCLEKEIQTNPTNPSNPNNTQNQPTSGEPWLNDGDFNWLTTGLIDYYRTFSSDWELVLNPFDDSGNPNIDYISVPEAIRDNKPEDGWELITYRYGYDYLSSPVSIPNNVPSSSLLGVSHPSYILYNKYTGLLRVLIYINRSELNHDYQTASILLRHEASIQDENQNALFTFSDPIAWALDDFKKQYAFEAANIVSVDDGYWLIGDFPMAYDPCVCNFPTNLLVESKLISTSEINLTGTVATEDVVTVNGNTQEVKSNPDYKEYFQRLDGSVKNGLKKYKDIDGLVKSFQKIIAKESTPKKKEESTLSLSKLVANLFKSSQQTEAPSSNGGFSLLKSAPKIGAIIGFLDFFIMGGKSGSNAKKQSVTPISFEANINISGTLATEGIGPRVKIATPGSAHNTSNLDREIPMYNEALGVFNLVETPEIEVTTYNYDSNAGISNGFSSVSLKQYKVKSDLNYALNPAADLEIMDIKSTIVISYEPSVFNNDFSLAHNLIMDHCFQPGNSCPFPRPVDRNQTSFTQSLSEDDLSLMGYEIETIPDTYADQETTARLNVGYLPIGCFKDISFLLNGGQGGRYSQPKMYCKIVVTLKREDDPNAQPVDMIMTYNVKVSDAPAATENTWAFSGPGGGIVFNSLLTSGDLAYPTPALIPFNIKFGVGDVIGPGLIEARESIIIGDNATILPGTHIIAPSVDINPPVDIPADVTIEIDIPGFIESCGSNSHTNFRITDFSSICNNTNLYDPSIPSFTSNEGTNFFNQDSSSNSNFNIIDIKVFPNPFNNNLNVRYKLSSDDLVNLTLQNSLGQIVAERNFTQQAGEHIEIIDGLSLPNGMYYLTIKTTDSIKTIKVSKQNRQ